MAVFSRFVRSRLGLGDRLAQSAVLALGTLGWATVGLGPMAAPGIAQPIAALPSCAAPGPDEYLLLVVLQTEAAQSKLLETLPPSVKAPTCNYLGSRVARMGGFQKPEDADAWASYLRDVASLPAFVAKPNATPNPQTNAQTNAQTNPQANPASPPISPLAASPLATSPLAASPQTSITAATTVQDPAALTAAAQSVAGAATLAPSAQAALPQPAQPPSLRSLAEPIAPPIETLPPAVIPTPAWIGAKIDVPMGNATASGTALQLAPAQLPEPIIPAAATVTVAPATAPPGTVQMAMPQVIPTPTAGRSPLPPYEPKVLSPGYAVLLEYGNQTSIVPILRQLTKRPVGLASYGQRPYLLVHHTADSAVALATLKTLGNNGFRIMVVNSELVTQLTPDVQIK